MRADVVLSWIGAAGVAVYLVHIHRQRTRSFLESRVVLLLYCVAGLLAVRGFFWLYGGPVLRAFTLLPAVVLPLAATLFTEALLRRHVPLVLKIWLAVGTPMLLLALPLSAEEPVRGLYFRALSIYVVLTFLALVLLLVGRRRKDLAPAENALADGITVAAALAVAVASTDFRWRPEWLDLRLGGLGGLFLVYACVRLSRLALGAGAGWRLLAELGWVVVKSATLALGFGLVMATPPSGWPAVAALALAFVLLFRILDLLRRGREGSSWDDLRRWFLQADLGDMASLRRSLAAVPWVEDPLLLEEGDLKGYDVSVLLRAFEAAPVRTLPDLRQEEATEERDTADREAAEQLVELLRSFGMRQAALLRPVPILLLLVSLPDVELAEGRLPDLAFLAKAVRGSLPGAA